MRTWIGADFIRRREVTSASVNDTTVFEIVNEVNKSRNVYADRGYAKWLAKSPVAGEPSRPRPAQGPGRRPLSPAQQRRNRGIARQRASFGEHPFARLALVGGKSVGTIGEPERG